MQVLLSVVFGLMVAVFIAYALLALTHATKFKYLSSRTKKISAIFIILSLITIAIASYLFFLVDWSAI